MTFWSYSWTKISYMCENRSSTSECDAVKCNAMCVYVIVYSTSKSEAWYFSMMVHYNCKMYNSHNVTYTITYNSHI